MKCIVDGCTSNLNSLLHSSSVTLHRIPNDNFWWDILSRFVMIHADARSNKNSRLCSLHFLKEDFIYVNGKRMVKTIAFPRIFPKVGEPFPSTFQEVNDPRIPHVVPTLPPRKTLTPQFINLQKPQTSVPTNPVSFNELLDLTKSNISTQKSETNNSEPKAKRYASAIQNPIKIIQ